MRKKISGTMSESWDNGQVSPVLQEPPALRFWLEGGMAVLNSDRQVVEVNQALADWLQLESQACQGKPFDELLRQKHQEWRPSIDECLALKTNFSRVQISALTGTNRHWFCLETARNPGGIFVRLDSVLPPQEELAEGGWSEFLQSEPGRRNLFVRLLRTETLLDNLVNRWPGVIFSQRADLSFQFVSPKMEELTGVCLQDWQRQPHKFWHVVHESDVEELRQQLKRAQQSPQGVTTTYRIRNAQTGRVAYILEHRQAIASESGLLLGYEGVWLDVTRQTIAEKRLSTAAWKETLAVLTMGLAHDFSNIMAGIHSLSESFLTQIKADHPFHEGLALIKHHSLQASQLVHRIINLHHGKTGERHYHNLNEIVSDLVDLVQKILPRRVQVTTLLAPEALPLYVDAVEFRQVIINLTINAADAMPQGGKLLVQTSMHDDYPVCGHVEGSWPRLPAICLTVQDDGCGIHARYLASIFDPFFTTKAMNKGSGLGLYNARLFVEKHQGAISVDSTEGAGTCFRIWLPQADFTEAEREMTEAVPPRRSLLLAGVAGSLLDETTEFLRIHGYHVVAANTPSSAREHLRNSEYSFVGLMLLIEPKDRDFTPLVREVRREKRPLQVILQVIGGHPDELETPLARETDLVITPDLSGDAVLEKLRTAFDHGV
ncbi:MAG TPA: ATP-binding protein [Candidatus Paceibacterota bacterium]|nr:ATP-binding protein [Verrucomicrobiota bacterium]HRY50912.1 ATP-binding protein [Candidatus Paceibacterota bacterium]